MLSFEPPIERDTLDRLRAPAPFDDAAHLEAEVAELPFMPGARLWRLQALDTVPPVRGYALVTARDSYWLDGSLAPLQRAIGDNGLALTPDTAAAYVDLYFRCCQTAVAPAEMLAGRQATATDDGVLLEADLVLGDGTLRAEVMVLSDGTVTVLNEDWLKPPGRQVNLE